jgi:hypothetical protein
MGSSNHLLSFDTTRTTEKTKKARVNKQNTRQAARLSHKPPSCFQNKEIILKYASAQIFYESRKSR